MALALLDDERRINDVDARARQLDAQAPALLEAVNSGVHGSYRGRLIDFVPGRTTTRGGSAAVMTPEELLASADTLLSSAAPPPRAWPRACALLTRLALERGLDRFWLHAEPEADRCSMRAQLLLLPTYAGTETATSAREAWYGLCRAVHHHAYELTPTAAELRGWHDTVAELLRQLGERTRTPPAPG